MGEQFLQLYNKKSAADSAYLIADGKVFFFITEADKFSLQGRNLVVGSTELVLGDANNDSCPRLETVLAVKGTNIKKIPANALRDGFQNIAFAMNVAIVEAKIVILTNEILKKDMQIDEKLLKERSICIEYYSIVNSIQNEYTKRRLPWLKELIDQYKTSLIFKKGEAFYKASESVKVETPKELAANMIEFPHGSVICTEGTIGESMYILESGQLEVSIQNQKVAVIEEKGTVVGEIAMLLSLPRTATIKARNTVIATRVSKEDLRKSSSPELVKNLLVSLTKKHYANVLHIEEINQKKAFMHAEGKPQEPHKTDVYRYSNELSLLKNSLEKCINSRKADYLEYILPK